MQSSDPSSVSNYPIMITSHQIEVWGGVRVELVQGLRQQSVEANLLVDRHTLFVGFKGGNLKGELRGDGHSLRKTNSGDCLYLVPAQHRYRSWDGPLGELSYMAIFLDPAWMSEVFAPALEPQRVELLPYLGLNNPEVRTTAMKLKAAVKMSGALGRLYGEGLATVLAAELIARHSNIAHPPSAQASGLSGWRLRQVTEYIDAHFADEIRLQDLANLVEMSPYHLGRAFKASTGVSPHRYHTIRRIEHAKTLMRDRRLTLTEIAQIVGYSDHSHFGVVFRKLVGMTPSAFRQQLP